MRLRAQKGRCGGFGLYEGKLFMTTKQVVYMLLAMLVAAAVSYAATPLVKTLTSRACWPYPSYGDLLFSVR